MVAQDTAAQTNLVTKEHRGPTGHRGPFGHRGPAGHRGPFGHRGHKGERGERGPKGGKRGPEGHRGNRGHKGHHGAQGLIGPVGSTGATEGLFGIADFFALMPGDNSSTVAVGTAVSFPQDGTNIGPGVIRFSPTQFRLGAIGTYLVQFQVSVDEAGQLAVAIGGVIQPNTVVGRATGTSQIIGMSLVTTTVVDEILSIINPPGNSTALTITPIAGGTHSVSAHLIITRVN